jgi:hypothetical protein
MITVSRHTGLELKITSGDPTPLAIELKRGEDVVYSGVSTYTSGEHTVDIPASKFAYNGSYLLEVGTEDFDIDAITPLLTKTEMQEIAPSLDDEDYEFIEEAVRYVIESVTAQVFAPTEGIKEFKVYGNDAQIARLPERAYSVDTDNYRLLEDNWSVTYLEPGEYTVSPIVAPNYYRRFKQGTYEIQAEWGWEFIPAQVKFAAKKLFNDYACKESLYRERYAKDVAAADWKLSFWRDSINGTGNVIVDQILEKFSVHRLGVI